MVPARKGAGRHARLPGDGRFQTVECNPVAGVGPELGHSGGDLRLDGVERQGASPLPFRVVGGVLGFERGGAGAEAAEAAGGVVSSRLNRANPKLRGWSPWSRTPGAGTGPDGREGLGQGPPPRGVGGNVAGEPRGIGLDALPQPPWRRVVMGEPLLRGQGRRPVRSEAGERRPESRGHPPAPARKARPRDLRAAARMAPAIACVLTD